MERHKLHSKPPGSTSNAVVWGAIRRDSTVWSSLIAFSDSNAAKVYSSQLYNLTATGNAQILHKLESNWTQGCYYVHHLAFIDAYLRLAEVSQVLENLVSALSEKNSAPC